MMQGPPGGPPPPPPHGGAGGANPGGPPAFPAFRPGMPAPMHPMLAQQQPAPRLTPEQEEAIIEEKVGARSGSGIAHGILFFAGGGLGICVARGPHAIDPRSQGISLPFEATASRRRAPRHRGAARRLANQRA